MRLPTFTPSCGQKPMGETKERPPLVQKPHPGIPPKGTKRTLPCPGCERLFFTEFGLMQHQEAKGH